MINFPETVRKGPVVVKTGSYTGRLRWCARNFIVSLRKYLNAF